MSLNFVKSEGLAVSGAVYSALKRCNFTKLHLRYGSRVIL
jgi:hypothetical protein